MPDEGSGDLDLKGALGVSPGVPQRLKPPQGWWCLARLKPCPFEGFGRGEGNLGGLMRPKAEALGYLEARPARLSCRGEHPDLQVREIGVFALATLSAWEGLEFVTPLIRKERI